MRTFAEHGYLGEDDQAFQQQLVARYGKKIKICFELNRYGQHLQQTLNVHVNNVPEIVSAILLTKIQSTFQAAMILCCKGMFYQTDMLIRCILDHNFKLEAVANDPEEVIKEWTDTADASRIRMMNRYHNFFNRVNNNRKLRKMLATKTEELKAGRPRDPETNQPIIDELSTLYFAQKAKREADYDSLYADTSNAVHGNLFSLEESLIFNDPVTKDKITGIRNEPDLEEVGNQFYILAKMMASTCNAICKVFKLDVHEVVDRLVEEMEKILEAEQAKGKKAF
jgi:hypothetical protein